MANEDAYKWVPQNGLQLELATTDPIWGGDIPKGLKNKLSKEGKIKEDKDGKQYIEKESLWDLLGYYTRDLRLGNLGFIEYEKAIDMIEYAGDCLREGYIKTFMAVLSKVISRVELSQSKGGFLRKRSKTYTKEERQEFEDKSNTSWFGSSPIRKEKYRR